MAEVQLRFGAIPLASSLLLRHFSAPQMRDGALSPGRRAAMPLEDFLRPDLQSSGRADRPAQRSLPPFRTRGRRSGFEDAQYDHHIRCIPTTLDTSCFLVCDLQLQAQELVADPRTVNNGRANPFPFQQQVNMG